MDIALLVSKIFAVYLVVSGLFLIFKAKTVPIMLKDFFDHPATVYLTGIILIFLSSMYLIQYNIWDGTWKTIVTVFVWAVLLKGLTYIFFPKMLAKISVKNRSFMGIWGLVSLLIGVYLFYLG